MNMSLYDALIPFDLDKLDDASYSWFILCVYLRNSIMSLLNIAAHYGLSFPVVEEIGDAIENKANGYYDSSVDSILLPGADHLWLNDLEQHTCQWLGTYVYREGDDVVIEFEPQDLLGVSVNGAVLEAPAEAHEICDTVELPHSDEGEGETSHYHKDEQDHQSSLLAPLPINHKAYEEAPEHLAHSEESHREHRRVELFLSGVSRLSQTQGHHAHQDPWEVSYGYASPDQLRKQEPHPLIQGKLQDLS
jgi:hypothetical protein